MKNNMLIQIKQPCHEDWNKMTPEKQGRFCASCTKSVIDFTSMTDNEIIRYLDKSSSKLCGRFNVEQLQRPLTETQLKPKKNWRYWLVSIASILLLMNRTVAQTIIGNRAIVDTSVVPTNHEFVKGKVISTQVANQVLRGTIIDDVSGKPIQGVSIVVLGKKIGVVTDKLGHFNLNTDNLSKQFAIIVSYVGYETKELNVNKRKLKELNIRIKEMNTTLMGETIWHRAN